jgi:hypothetical protein
LPVDVAPKEEVEPVVAESLAESLYEQFCGYGLFLWDGLGFFGFGTHKLNRLRGIKTTFFTRFENISWDITTTLWLTCAIIILKEKGDEIGDQKSNALNLKHKGSYEFNVREKFGIHIVHYLDDTATIGVIKDYYNTLTPEEQDYAGDGRGIISDNTEDWDWHDNKFAGDYLCSKMDTFFLEELYFDPIGITPYHQRTKFHFPCYLMQIYAKATLRMHYFIPYTKEDFIAVYENTSPDKGKQTATEEELKNAIFLQ